MERLSFLSTGLFPAAMPTWSTSVRKAPGPELKMPSPSASPSLLQTQLSMMSVVPVQFVMETDKVQPRMWGQDYSTDEKAFCTLLAIEQTTLIAPPRQMRDRTGAVGRLNLLYWRTSPTGFSELDVRNVPPELLQRGVTEEMWRRWMAKLADVNKHTFTRSCYFTSLCATGFLCFCLVNGITTCTLQAWNKRLLQWQQDVNQELEPLGILCKSQSECCESQSRSPLVSSISRWISFALTPVAIKALRAEPHQRGKEEAGCVCCCEGDESHFCMHP